MESALYLSHIGKCSKHKEHKGDMRLSENQRMGRLTSARRAPRLDIESSGFSREVPMAEPPKTGRLPRLEW
jgi:hypothetical protein